jgi:hypothetical protein
MIRKATDAPFYLLKARQSIINDTFCLFLDETTKVQYQFHYNERLGMLNSE